MDGKAERAIWDLIGMTGRFGDRVDRIIVIAEEADAGATPWPE
jgi:hypothetical protein